MANLTPRQKQVLRAIEKFPELLEIRDKFHDADTAGAGCLNPERGVALVLASLGETHEPNALESHSPRFRRLAERLELDGESSSVTEEDLLIRLARFARTKTRSGADETDALDENLFRDLAPLLDAAASAATSLANQGLSEFDASSPPAREREAPAAEAPAAEKENLTASAAAPAPAAKKKAPPPTAAVAEKRPVASLPALTPDEAKAAQMSKERLERVMAKSKMPSAKYLRSIPSLKKKGAGEDAFDDCEFDAEYKLSSPTTSSKDLAVEKQYALSAPGPSGDFGDVSANVKATRERAERAVAEKKKTKAEKKKASAEPFRNY